MAVVLVRWPEQAERLGPLRQALTPHLLLVAPDVLAPAPVDPLEDWVRLPAADGDVRARLATLEARAAAASPLPTIDDDGILRFRDGWVPLSPVERGLAQALVERYGAVVGREVLSRRAWPCGAPTRNALDVHILRLRRRIATVGLEVRTVRSRGYLLQVATVAVDLAR